MIQHQSQKEEFFKPINTEDSSIQFTVEEVGPDDSIPFLDILITPQKDGTFTIRVYRKLTHTDLYLQWDSYHNLATKYRVLQKQQDQQKKKTSKRQIPSGQLAEKKIVVSYSQGISESFKTICRKYGVKVHFKGGTTLKNLLVLPKDKETITKKSSVIYWFRCDKIDCEDEYI